MTTTLETDVFALLAPGGLITADTIAHNLAVPRWKVRRALEELRRRGDAFQNRRAEWQVSAGQRRPMRQARR